MTTMFCRHCGKEVLTQCKTCPGCGCDPRGNKTASDSSLIPWSYAAAVLMPLIGIILGIVLLVRLRVGHALGVLFISLFFWGFWLAFFEAL